MEVVTCENVNTAPVPSKIPENALRYTRSEEDLTYSAPNPVTTETSNSSPRPEFSLYSGTCEFDDGECWSQEDDDIIQVWGSVLCLYILIRFMMIMPENPTISSSVSINEHGLSCGFYRMYDFCCYSNIPSDPVRRQIACPSSLWRVQPVRRCTLLQGTSGSGCQIAWQHLARQSLR